LNRSRDKVGANVRKLHKTAAGTGGQGQTTSDFASFGKPGYVACKREDTKTIALPAGLVSRRPERANFSGPSGFTLD